MKYSLRLATIVFSATFLLLTLYSSFYPQEWNYGFNHLRYFSVQVSLIFIIVGFASIIPSVNKKIEELIILSGKRLFSSRKKILFLTISIIFLFIFWSFKTVIIYGDGGDIVRNFETDKIIMTSPLTYIILHSTHEITSRFGFTPYQTIGMTSAIAGMIFVYVSLLLSDAIFTDKIKKVLLFLFLVSMGSMQLFFGHIEQTTIFSTGILVYIYTSYFFIKKRVHIAIPTIVLMITFFLHMSAGFLFPSLLYLICIRNKKIIKPFLQVGGIGLLLLVLLSSYIYIFEWNKEIPTNPIERYGRFGYGGVPAKFHPLFEIKYPGEQHATMFSLYHLNLIFNEHMLISPAGGFLILYFLFNRKTLSHFDGDIKRKFFMFMLILMGFHLLYALTGSMAISGRQDWDIFAPVSISITILSVYILFNNYTKKELLYISIILITLSLVHAIPWIMANHLGLPTPPTSLTMSNI